MVEVLRTSIGKTIECIIDIIIYWIQSFVFHILLSTIQVYAKTGIKKSKNILN